VSGTRNSVMQWAALALGLVGCAGDLDAPERFASLAPVAATGAAGAGGVAASGAGTGGAGMGGSGAGSGATPDAGSTPATDAATGCDAVGILARQCAGPVCHSAGAAQVDLVSAGVVARVVDQMSSDTGLCAGQVLAPSDGTGGLMLEKLTVPTPSCGSKMPLDKTLSADELTCLTTWLMSPGGT